MNLLLDTHAFLWALMDTERLSAPAKFELLNEKNSVFVSAVSFWEIALKYSLGKLELNGVSPPELAKIATDKMGFSLLDLEVSCAVGFGKTPRYHGDPFDRMLIHQAIELGFCLVSADRKFQLHEASGLKLIW